MKLVCLVIGCRARSLWRETKFKWNTGAYSEHLQETCNALWKFRQMRNGNESKDYIPGIYEHFLLVLVCSKYPDLDVTQWKEIELSHNRRKRKSLFYKEKWNAAKKHVKDVAPKCKFFWKHLMRTKYLQDRTEFSPEIQKIKSANSFDAFWHRLATEYDCNNIESHFVEDDEERKMYEKQFKCQTTKEFYSLLSQHVGTQNYVVSN